MSVTHPPLKKLQLLMHLGTALNHRDIVHNLPKSQNSFLLQIRRHHICRDPACIVINSGSRYTGGHHDKDIGRHLLCLSQNIIDPGHPGYIGRLMRVDDKGSGTAQNSLGNQFLWCHKCGLQMQVAVNKSGTHIPSIQVFLPDTFVSADPGDHPIRHSYIPIYDLSCKNINDLCIFQNKICFPQSTGDI